MSNLRGARLHDTNNSTTSNLAGAAVFTGVSRKTLNYGVALISVYADVASATDGLVIEQSHDGVTWNHNDSYNILAGNSENYSINLHDVYYRVKYTNGAGAQSSFELTAVLKPGFKASSHRAGDEISNDDDAEFVKAMLTGEAPDGSFPNVQTTVDGHLKISDQADGLPIAKGDVTGHDYEHKFGEIPDFDTGDGIATCWDGADDGNINAMQYTYSTSADIDSISSSNAGDTQTIEITGLDTNWDEVTQTATLNGQTRVALTTSLIRVYRMKNTGSTDLAGYVYGYVNGAITAGVPDTAADVRAVIQNSENQTLMAVYTIPNGYTGYMRDLFASLIGASKSTNYTVYLKVRPLGGVFQTKIKFGLNENGTSHTRHEYVEPETIAGKSDIEIRIAITAGSVSEANVGGGFDIVLVED